MRPYFVLTPYMRLYYCDLSVRINLAMIIKIYNRRKILGGVNMLAFITTEFQN